MKKISNKIITGIILASIFLAGCGGSVSSTADKNANVSGVGNGIYDGEYLPEEDLNYEEDNQVQEESSPEETSQKLVYEANIRLETTEYSETLKAIKQLIKDNNGLIENEYEQSENSYYDNTSLFFNTLKIRVPSDNYETFLSGLSGQGNIVSKETSTKNITKNYYNTSATIDALKIQQERLLEMMKNAQSVEDMITIESRLTEVETELKQYQAELSSMDTDVAYSTINIDIEEVAEYTENGEPIKTNKFIDRLKNTIEETIDSVQIFFEGILFGIIRLAPFIVIFGIIGIPIYKVCKKRKINKKNSDKKDGQNQ